MSFVIGRSQKRSLFEPTQQTLLQPGPGSYSIVLGNSKNIWQCAPFNASQAKISCFNVQGLSTGPGSYQPKYPKYINRGQENQGYVFASKVNRFKNQNKDFSVAKNTNAPLKLIYYQEDQQNQGNSKNIDHTKNFENNKNEISNYATHYSLSPTQKISHKKQVYAQKLERSKSVMQQLRKQNKEHRVQSIKGKRDFVRVILTSSTNTQNIQSRYIYKSIQGKGLGPGSYLNVDFQLKNKNITKWNLNKQKRFKTSDNIIPGPGAYKIINQIQPIINDNNQKDKRLTAPFASNVMKSHMDVIIYKTNIPFKAALMQDQKMKDLSPGPGSYSIQPKYKNKISFNYGNIGNNFGSTNRTLIYQTNNNNNNKLGPGQYDILLNSLSVCQKNKKCNQHIKDMRKQIFQKKGKISDNYNKNNTSNQAINQQQIFQGEHSFIHQNADKRKNKLTKFYSLQQRCFSRLGTLNQQQRFRIPQANIFQPNPGPGEYCIQYVDSGFLINQSTKKVGSSVFKSNTNRASFENRGMQVPFYNVIRSDIGYKAQKMKRYIENLKKINVVKAPFEVAEKRFANRHAKQACLTSKLTKRVHEQANKKDAGKKIKNKLSSAFKSKTKRQFIKSEKKPGPGDYDSQFKFNGICSSLQKRSFNRGYGYIKMPSNFKYEQYKNNLNLSTTSEQLTQQENKRIIEIDNASNQQSKIKTPVDDGDDNK